eukprot:6841989-Prymnesium_polylepis.2
MMGLSIPVSPSASWAARGGKRVDTSPYSRAPTLILSAVRGRRRVERAAGRGGWVGALDLGARSDLGARLRAHVSAP